MINYINKGHSLTLALKEAGLYLKEEFDLDGVGTWVSEQNHEVINQFIIDFDEVGAVKAELKEQLVKDSQEYVDGIILSKYPKFEVDSWQNQLNEARAYIADNTAIVPTIEEIATQRSVSKLQVANRILTKAAQFATFSGKQAGRRQRLEDLIDAASTVEALNAIPKFAGV